LNKYKVDEVQWFKTPSPLFELSEKDNYARLTISRSFHDKNVDPHYDSVLANAFDMLKRKKIGNLIIDLRDNEGGSEHQQAELMSYLYNKPFKLYENIYVSRLDYRPLKEVIAVNEKDTSRLLDNNEDEWMRRISDNLWINNYEYYEGLQLQPPKANVFQGNLYILMNGGSFSSTSALIANIKNTTKAKFIGEESGGLYEGPTGGQTVPIILPNSKIMIRISPNINIGFLYKKNPIGRGVLPDYPVNYSIEDILGKRDLEIEKAKVLIMQAR
jgi:C-terminal processing protease CtpA/Prc